MLKKYHRLVEKEPKIIVATHAQDNQRLRLITLTAAFAGAFYFFADSAWRVLFGG